jgi:hypothetical protein
MRDDVIALGEDHMIFVAQGVGKGANETNKPLRPAGMWALC